MLFGKRRVVVCAVLFWYLLACMPHQARGAYYWVGGSGSWSDLSHWSLASGGVPTLLSLPGPADTVIFDQNSFSSTGFPAQVELPQNAFAGTFRFLVNGDVQFTSVGASWLNTGGHLELNRYFLPASNVSIRQTTQGIANAVISIPDAELHTLEVDAGAGRLTLTDRCWIADFRVIQGEVSIDSDSIHLDLLYLSGSLPKKVKLSSGYCFISTIFLSASTDSLLAATSVIHGLVYLNPGGAYVALGEVHLSSVPYSFFSYSTGVFRAREVFTGKCEVQLLHDADIDSLIIEDPRGVKLGTGNVRIRYISARGTCSDPIFFSSTIVTAGPSQIRDTYSADLEYCVFSKIQFTVPVTAINSTDNGGSSGINLVQPRIPARFYWIGGKGDYHDPRNWSLSSGGPSINCVPWSTDTAVFDDHSFTSPDTVFIQRFVQVGAVLVSSPDLLAFHAVNGMSGFDLFGSFLLEHRVEGLQNIQLNFFLRGRSELKLSGSPSGGFLLNAPGQELVLLDPSLELEMIRFQDGFLNLNGRTLKVGAFLMTSIGFTELRMENTHLETNILELNISNRPGIVYAAGSRIIVHHSAYIQAPNTNLPQLHMKRSVFQSTESQIGQVNIARLNLELDGFYEFSGTQVDTLVVFPGEAITFSKTRLYVNRLLVAKGTCQKPVFLITDMEANVPADILIGPATLTELDHVTFRGIRLQGGIAVHATNSTDLGGSSGFTLSGGTGHKLYWVGGTGNWKETAHWSFSSGGATAGCIPGTADTVIFDQQSFQQSGDTVFLAKETGWICRVLDMRGVDKPFHLIHRISHYSVPGLIITHSAYFSPYVKASTRINFDGTHTGADIDLNGINSPQLTMFFSGGGTWHLDGKSQQTGEINLIHARLHVWADSLKVRRFKIAEAQTFFPYTVAYLHQTVLLTSEFQKQASGEVYADSATICFSNGFTAWNYQTVPDVFHRVIRYPVTASIATFESNAYTRHLEMSGTMATLGSWTADSLFIVNANRIIFNSGSDYQVNQYFQAIGNPCLKIHLLGVGGNGAQLHSASARFYCDYLVIENLPAFGTAAFHGGWYSGLSGYTGAWTVSQGSKVISRLADEVYLACSDSMKVNVGTRYGSAMALQWSTGETVLEKWFPVPGLYPLRVSYPGNCEIRDTLRTERVSGLTRFLPPDTVLCRADSFLILPDIGPAMGWDRLWSTGHTGAELAVKSNGSYWLRLQRGSCIVEDTTHVRFSQLTRPLLSISDSTLCYGDSILLSPGIQPSDSFHWLDNHAGLTRWVNQPGVYSLRYLDDHCVYEDSTTVSGLNLRVHLSGNSRFCPGDSSLLSAVPVSGLLTWQESAGGTFVGNTYPARKEGWYFLTRQDSGCSAKDSLLITFREVPQFTLPSDTALCPGGKLAVNFSGKGYIWLWQDGKTDSLRTLNQEGLYWLEAYNGECRLRDTLMLSGVELPTEKSDWPVWCPGTELRIPMPSLFGEEYFYQNQKIKDTIRLNGAGNHVLTIRNAHCERTDLFEIKEGKLPEKPLPDSVDFCELENGLLAIHTAPGNSLVWEGQTVSGEAVRINRAGRFSYQLENQDACILREELLIKGCDCRLLFPTAFTPNGDTHNPEFRGYGCPVTNYRLQIYNRWGELVFESDDPVRGWDASWKGTVVPEGVYMRIARYDTYSETGILHRVEDVGSVVVIR